MAPTTRAPRPTSSKTARTTLRRSVRSSADAAAGWRVGRRAPHRAVDAAAAIAARGSVEHDRVLTSRSRGTSSRAPGRGARGRGRGKRAVLAISDADRSAAGAKTARATSGVSAAARSRSRSSARAARSISTPRPSRSWQSLFRRAGADAAASLRLADEESLSRRERAAGTVAAAAALSTLASGFRDDRGFGIAAGYRGQRAAGRAAARHGLFARGDGRSRYRAARRAAGAAGGECHRRATVHRRRARRKRPAPDPRSPRRQASRPYRGSDGTAVTSSLPMPGPDTGACFVRVVFGSSRDVRGRLFVVKRWAQALVAQIDNAISAHFAKLTGEIAKYRFMRPYGGEEEPCAHGLRRCLSRRSSRPSARARRPRCAATRNRRRRWAGDRRGRSGEDPRHTGHRQQQVVIASVLISGITITNEVIIPGLTLMALPVPFYLLLRRRQAMTKPIHQMTIKQWEAVFPTGDASCAAYLVAHRWPYGSVICPRCGNPEVRLARYAAALLALQRVLAIGHELPLLSYIAGTVFENTNKPLRDWFASCIRWSRARKAWPRCRSIV